MTTVLLSSASNTLPMVSRDSYRLGPLAHREVHPSLSVLLTRNDPLSSGMIRTRPGPSQSYSHAKHHSGYIREEAAGIRVLRKERPIGYPEHLITSAGDLAHLKFENSARALHPRQGDSSHSLYRTKLASGPWGLHFGRDTKPLGTKAPRQLS